MPTTPRPPSSADVRRLLAAPDPITSVLQPIVDIRSGAIMGYEALCRFAGDWPHATAAWFRAARQAGLGPALEARAWDAAIHRIPELPRARFLSINLSPDALVADEMRDRLRMVDPSRLVLELTEAPDAPDLALQAAHLRALRRDGMRLAVDDIGSGFSSLARVLRLGADFLKVDRELVQGCADDHLKRYVLESLATLARKQGGHVIAEGVEDLRDLLVVHEVGIRYVQGYLLGRPQPGPAELAPDHHRWLRALTAHQPLSHHAAEIDLTEVESGRSRSSATRSG